MKKILAMLLVFAMALTMVPMTMVGSALAADETVNKYEMAAQETVREGVWLNQALEAGDIVSFYIYIGDADDITNVKLYARDAQSPKVYGYYCDGTVPSDEGEATQVYGSSLVYMGEDVGNGWYKVNFFIKTGQSCPSGISIQTVPVDEDLSVGECIIAGIKVNGVELDSSKVLAKNGGTAITPSTMNIPSDLVAQQNSHIAGMKVSVGTDISVNCYAEDIPEGATAVVKFIVAGKDVEVEGKVTEVEGEYVFTYTGLLPEQMGDDITMELYVDGVLVDSKTKSVEDYLNSLKTPAGDAIKMTYEVSSTNDRLQFYVEGLGITADSTIELVVKLPATIKENALGKVRVRTGSNAGQSTDVYCTIADGIAAGLIHSLGDDWYKITATVPGNAAATDTVCVTIYYATATEGFYAGQSVWVQSVKVISETGITTCTSNNLDPEKIRESAATIDSSVAVPGPSVLDNLVNDMLMYGAAAQEYRDYNVEDLVADLDDLEFEALASTYKVVSNGTDYKFTAATLWYDYTNNIIFKFQAADTANLTVEINDVEVEYEDLGNGTYKVMTDAISAVDFDKEYTAELIVGGNVAASATYSVNSYVYAKQASDNANLANLVKALYNYGASADVYAE